MAAVAQAVESSNKPQATSNGDVVIKATNLTKAFSETVVALDKASFTQRHSSECPANQATILSECEKGAREFWQATPHHTRGTVLAAEEFRALAVALYPDVLGQS